MATDPRPRAAEIPRRIALVAAALTALAACTGLASANHSPDFTISPSSCVAPCELTVTDTTAYPPGEAAQGESSWLFEAEGGSTRRAYTGPSVSHTFADPGRYRIWMWNRSDVDYREVVKEVTVGEGYEKRCDPQGRVCLLGDAPFVGPGWLTFELPSTVRSLRGSWQTGDGDWAGTLDEPRFVEHGPWAGKSTWEALLPPIEAPGSIMLELTTDDGSEEQVRTELTDIPVLASAEDIRATVKRRKRAFRATLGYRAHRNVRAKMLTVLFGTKRNDKWRELAKRELDEPGAGEQLHKQRFRKQLVRRKCRRHGPCRIASVAFVFAEGYMIDGFLTLEKVRLRSRR